jgi:hypothetical protein
MQPFARQNMSLDQRMQRRKRRCAGANLIRQRGHAQIDAFASIAFALPVKRLMLAELLEQEHCQEVRAGKAARSDVEWRRRPVSAGRSR